MVAGVLLINNIGSQEQEEISNYITNFVDATKQEASVDYTKLFINSVKNNLWLALWIWFAGMTVIGIFVVYGVVCFRGFVLGYSISSIIATLGVKSGGIFILSSMLLQNLVFIPILFALAMSGIRLSKSIIKDRRRENIKLEILRHTIFSAGLSVMLILASFVETYVSTNIFMLTSNIL